MDEHLKELIQQKYGKKGGTTQKIQWKPKKKALKVFHEAIENRMKDMANSQFDHEYFMEQKEELESMMELEKKFKEASAQGKIKSEKLFETSAVFGELLTVLHYEELKSIVGKAFSIVRKI